jgi:glycosyltransferase involved in cell wall biosynthesis
MDEAAETSETGVRRVRVLLVSSFVRPHAGGVEEFVESTRALLDAEGCEVRILACRLPGYDTSADAVVPTHLVGSARWPVPTKWSAIRREVSTTDIVLANNARHLLPVLAVLAARLERRPALLFIHGSGESGYAGKRVAGVVRELFQQTLGRLAVRLSWPVSVSRVGVRGARKLYGVEAAYLPYPLRELPMASTISSPSERKAFRVVFVGRLSPEKDPLLAVRAVELLRERREAELAMYGDGPLRPRLDALAQERPWLSVLGAHDWRDVQAAQANAHACLSTSSADNVQVALLEALSRGIPAVSTQIGDAPAYYCPRLAGFCVCPRNPGQLAVALDVLAESYDVHRRTFADNAIRLRQRHRRAGDELVRLIRSAVDRDRPRP